ncbi:hypothetical protein JCGZ_14873 [Jatropha curcas]|uniref:Uncharacterized protein n=1 Tax=Jatropha curcas TaxID=180498 RepID=A0A067KB02_JATCU|nr:hypothetical protein JCGZ_14873 [Jatropha curcas]
MIKNLEVQAAQLATMVANRLKDDECTLDYEETLWKIALLEEDKGFEDAKPIVQLRKCEFIQAVVLLHPSFVTVDDIKEPKKNDIELMHVKFGE